MKSDLYKIVFDGEVAAETTSDAVKDNLAQLFKSERSQVERLFDRGPVNIKRGLSDSDADRYLHALHRAGAIARKERESEPTVTLSLVDDNEPEHSTSAAIERMECPKCGHGQPSAIQCESCGIVIQKFLARQAEHATRSNGDAGDGVAHPYAPPRAQVAEPMPAYGELKAFTVQGRIGRLRYLAWTMTLSAVALGLMAIAGIGFAISDVLGSIFIGLIGIGFLVISVQIGVQRLHDIGWSGWFLFLNLVPVIGTLFPLVMLLMPGSGGINRFGPPQAPNSKSVKLLAALWLLVPILGIIAAIALPAYQQYLHRMSL